MKNITQGLTTVFKWVLFVLCAVLGVKLFLAVASIFTTGVAIATLAMWGAAAVLGGAGLLFLGVKVLSGKKK